jgi:hypothetical protein
MRNMDKLEKNRQSARLSRERKKFYMEMLETKVEELEKEISKTKEELDSTNNYLQKVVAQNETVQIHRDLDEQFRGGEATNNETTLKAHRGRE